MDTQNFTSNIFHLSETPYCVNAKKRKIIKVNDEETIQLVCLTRSSGPIDDIRFSWYINSTSEGTQTPISPPQFKSNGTRSYFRYQVTKDIISETVICQPSNAAGASNQPCIFFLTSSTIQKGSFGLICICVSFQICNIRRPES